MRTLPTRPHRPRLLITVAIVGTGLAGILVGMSQSYTMLIISLLSFCWLYWDAVITCPPRS